jgi:hypothetical protein
MIKLYFIIRLMSYHTLTDRQHTQISNNVIQCAKEEREGRMYD